ncbi:MAG: hypothetical protein HKO59_03655 [Phycisphaerales bacterium]|nr:hypothetical protein [Phycisphaerales bacterium]NNM25077.1 hypothetical protein [Phycisphaerales bacterium]
MNVYQSNPDMLPDSAFTPATLDHLVVGNRGRMLDQRRTPVTIVGVVETTGFVVLRIDDFEDRDATWSIPFEEIDRYQFALDAQRVDDATRRRLAATVTRLNHPLCVPADGAQRALTEKRVAGEEKRAAAWLATASRFIADSRPLPDPDTRRGDPVLGADLLRYLATRGLDDMEEAFATQYVSAPHSGELVKGHRIVIAELGFVGYEGKMIRDPGLFNGPWSRERRAEHVCARLGFIRALFGRLGRSTLAVYRGLSIEGDIEPRRRDTFVSTTLARAVAESHFDCGRPGSTRMLLGFTVPVSRVFMTFFETPALSRQFLEAEAVLFDDAEMPVL